VGLCADNPRLELCAVFTGDCWLLAAIASLTLNEEILARVVPLNQSFQENYAGIFHFQAPRLPSPLRVNGCYEALSGGATTEGFEDFTGGIAEWYELRKAPPNLFKIIQKALQKGSLLGCSIDVSPRPSLATSGLTPSVPAAPRPPACPPGLPWGPTHPRWHCCPNWNSVDPEVRERLTRRHEDGEFCPAGVSRSRQKPEGRGRSPNQFRVVPTLENQAFREQGWARGFTAGAGCTREPRRTCPEPLRGHLFSWAGSLRLIWNDGHRRLLRERKQCGFGMTGQTNIHLSRNFFLTHRARERSDTFINLREVLNQFKLPPGEYILVPSTFEPNKDGDFCVRVFSEKKADYQVVDDEIEADLDENDASEDDIDDGFRRLFAQLAGELQPILGRVLAKRQDIKSDGFSIETCKIMVDMLDSDGSGKLGLKEFYVLWTKIQKYQKIYREIDVDRSGTMNSYEMRKALEEAGNASWLFSPFRPAAGYATDRLSSSSQWLCFSVL
uniref:Calpain-2 catalytic subunit n=1 Tax=Panthera tigris altaica TaxID=74533 RepID=A0A8C9JY78_PANTA